MQNNEQFLSTKEAAKLLGISPVAVFKRIKSGSIPAIKVGRNYVIPSSALPLKITKRKKTSSKKEPRTIPHNKKTYISLDEPKELTLTHDNLFTTTLDLDGRDIVIAFNEPAFKATHKNATPTLDAKLNARILAYFLPAVQIAQTQKKRPRLIIVSAVNTALRWNAHSEHERKIMMADNELKVDFIVHAIEHFFPDTFSLVHVRQLNDFMKISERKLDLIWNIFEKRYPEEIQKLKHHFLRFKNPKAYTEILSGSDIEKVLHTHESVLRNAFRYAIVHLFGLGDINLSYDYIHNPKGYCSIGEHNEAVFNIIRKIGYTILKDIGEAIFDQEVFCFDNAKIVIKDEQNAPPPYNGASRTTNGTTSLDEVTFENKLPLEYYDTRPRLSPSMQYLYRIIPQDIYVKYWDTYRGTYYEKKERLREAYAIDNSW